MNNIKSDTQLKFEICQELGECYTQIGDMGRAADNFKEAENS